MVSYWWLYNTQRHTTSKPYANWWGTSINVQDAVKLPFPRHCCHGRISPEHTLKRILNVLTGARCHQLPQQWPPGCCGGPEQECK